MKRWTDSWNLSKPGNNGFAGSGHIPYLYFDICVQRQVHIDSRSEFYDSALVSGADFHSRFGVVHDSPCKSSGKLLEKYFGAVCCADGSTAVLVFFGRLRL